MVDFETDGLFSALIQPDWVLTGPPGRGKTHALKGLVPIEEHAVETKHRILHVAWRRTELKLMLEHFLQLSSAKKFMLETTLIEDSHTSRAPTCVNIDYAQGSEFEGAIISAARNRYQRTNISFLHDRRRVNVAFSRCRGAETIFLTHSERPKMVLYKVPGMSNTNMLVALLLKSEAKDVHYWKTKLCMYQWDEGCMVAGPSVMAAFMKLCPTFKCLSWQ